MGEICGDNRFELIEKYKSKLVEATNIESSKDEMAVIDSILFRFWQMGWLDKLEVDVVPRAEVARLQSQVERLKRYDEERDIAFHARLIHEMKENVAREIFARIDELLLKHSKTELTDDDRLWYDYFGYELAYDFAKLKQKYTESE